MLSLPAHFLLSMETTPVAGAKPHPTAAAQAAPVQCSGEAQQCFSTTAAAAAAPCERYRSQRMWMEGGVGMGPWKWKWERRA